MVEVGWKSRVFEIAQSCSYFYVPRSIHPAGLNMKSSRRFRTLDWRCFSRSSWRFSCTRARFQILKIWIRDLSIGLLGCRLLPLTTGAGQLTLKVLFSRCSFRPSVLRLATRSLFRATLNSERTRAVHLENTNARNFWY